MDDIRSSDPLADELRTLAGLRSRTAVRDRPLPTLDALLPDFAGDHEARYAARQALVDQGIERVADDAHRHSAAALLGSGSGRWRPIAKRGAEAAAAFNVGWDAYRRRRPSTGTSLLQETIDELSGALAPSTPATPAPPRPDPSDVPLVRLGPATGDDDRPAPATPPTPPGDGPRRSTRTLLLVALGLVTSVLALGAVLSQVSARSDGSDAGRNGAPPLCGNLTAAVGRLPDGASDTLRGWVAPFRRAAADLPERSTRCVGLMEQQAGHVFQRISAGDDGGVGALMAPSAGDEVVALGPLEFPAFRHAEFDEIDRQKRIGSLLGRDDRDDGTRVARFTTGALVQEPGEAPVLTVTGAIWSRWEDEGGLDGRLGRPLTDRYGSSTLGGDVQAFEGGRIITDYVDGTMRVEWATAADRELPDDHIGAVLVAENGITSWFIDPDTLERRWITTTVDYGCADEAHQAPIHREVSTMAIVQIPIGPAFRCR